MYHITIVIYLYDKLIKTWKNIYSSGQLWPQIDLPGLKNIKSIFTDKNKK